MIRAVIFDLNGVLVKGPWITKRLIADFGISKKDALMTFKEVMGKIRKPGADEMFSYWKPHFKRWNIDLTKDKWQEYWFSPEKLVDDMVAIARNAKKRGIKIIILSNNFRERTAFYDEKFPVLRKLADKIYYSWQTGFVKPSKEALELILKDFPFAPSEFLYFDDNEDNVVLAKNLGIKTYLFRNPADVAKKIKHIKLKRRHDHNHRRANEAENGPFHPPRDSHWQVPSFRLYHITKNRYYQFNAQNRQNSSNI